MTRGLVVRFISPRLASQSKFKIVFSKTSSAKHANSTELSSKYNLYQTKLFVGRLVGWFVSR